MPHLQRAPICLQSGLREMTLRPEIIFVSLAENQALFFKGLADRLIKNGIAVSHICFHEGASKMLEGHGQKAYNAFAYHPEDVSQIAFENFDVANAGLLIGHEKAAYEEPKSKLLEKKFKRHLAAVETIIQKRLEENTNLIMVQELGGFTSVLGSYFAARKYDIDNWFIEPAFFKGRVFFTKNSFKAPEVKSTNLRPSAELKSYLSKSREQETIVVPIKDKLHYRSATSKLLDTHNIKRLFQKMVAKYISGEQEEFSHIGGHVKRHLRMFFNSIRLKKYYDHELPKGDYIYYPLHVPADFALTIRSPEYLDQYSIIDYLCRIAPLGHKVIIKEHPALIGAVNLSRVKDIMERHDNLIVLSPDINNHKVLRNAKTIVTVNSKSGAEALLYKKPVIVLGDGFYSNSSLVQKVGAPSELAEHLLVIPNPITDDGIEQFFNKVWQSCSPGELYDVSHDNLDIFSKSLSAAIGLPQQKS